MKCAHVIITSEEVKKKKVYDIEEKRTWDFGVHGSFRSFRSFAFEKRARERGRMASLVQSGGGDDAKNIWESVEQGEDGNLLI